ncbi:MAG: hypothetical protein ACRCWG_12170 [Sarcina sp.]
MIEKIFKNDARCLELRTFLVQENKVSFEIYIKNNNKFDIFDINIKNRIPTCFKYVANTLCIEDIKFNDFMGIEKIYIDNLYEDEKIKISYEIEKIHDFKFNYIDVEISYRNNNDIYTQVQSTIIEEYIFIRKEIINKKRLEISKKANCSTAIVSEVISYEISIKNVAKYLIKNIEVVDIQGKDIEIVGQYIYLNNKKLDIGALSKGVYVKYLEENEEMFIRFNVKILGKANNSKIKNIVRVSYEYELEGIDMYATDEVECEEIKVYSTDLEIEKKANKKAIILGEEIIFEINIKNKGEIDCYSISFYESLGEEIEFIAGSFYKEDSYINISTFENGINIGDILKGEELTLYYKVLVKKISATGFIKSEITANFKYKCDEKSPIKIFNTEKKEFKIEATNPGFTEFEIGNIFILESQVLDIVDISSSIEIEESYVVRSASGKNLNGDILNSFKLVVIGYLNISLEYLVSVGSDELYIKKEKQKFVEDIILAEDYKVGTGVSIKGHSDNIYCKKLDEKKIMYKNSVFVEVIIKGF